MYSIYGMRIDIYMDNSRAQKFLKEYVELSIGVLSGRCFVRMVFCARGVFVDYPWWYIEVGYFIISVAEFLCLQSTLNIKKIGRFIYYRIRAYNCWPIFLETQRVGFLPFTFIWCSLIEWSDRYLLVASLILNYF